MMNRGTLAGTALVLAAATGGAAQQPSRTVQQDFDDAVALDAGTDRAASLTAWTTLVQRTKPGSRSHAITLVRQSSALWLVGRDDEALAAAHAGLAGLPVGDATLNGDRATAYSVIGRIARRSLDYAGAAQAFAAAEALASDPATRLGLQLALIEMQTFTDPVAAAASLARASAILAQGRFDAGSQAMLAERHAVLAMNTGDFATARTEGQRAVKLLGGLTLKADLHDVSARNDAALAMILDGKADGAREYLAYTGAGRLPNMNFDPATAMIVPDCGGEAGLKPADLAVIDFSIGDDGAVSYSAPVYAAGGGAVGLEFARAARAWSWTPDQVKQLPVFYRHNVRVEMRCSTAFQRPSISKLLRADLADWLEGKGIAVADAPPNDAAALPRQRAALAAADAKGDKTALALLPLLLALQDNSVLPREEVHALAVRALAIATMHGAPPAARLGIAETERVTAAAGDMWGPAYARRVESLLAAVPYAADPRARSALRLMVADAQKGSEGTALLRQVADDPALKSDDPMRVGALVRLASREQAAGDIAAARASFDRSGLSASQCALLDSPPRMLAAGGSFPMEAMQWGFEGWTQAEFDVGPDGRVVNERAILSYPAFVFTKAGTATVRGARFSKSYRPDGGLGCGGLSQRVRFKMG